MKNKFQDYTMTEKLTLPKVVVKQVVVKLLKAISKNCDNSIFCIHNRRYLSKYPKQKNFDYSIYLSSNIITIEFTLLNENIHLYQMHEFNKLLIYYIVEYYIYNDKLNLDTDIEMIQSSVSCTNIMTTIKLF